MCSYNVAYIYVDDVRNAPNISEDIGLITCRSYKQAINAIDHFIQRNVEIILDLDHDLGGIKSGYDVAKYFISTGYKNMKFKVRRAARREHPSAHEADPPVREAQLQ